MAKKDAKKIGKSKIQTKESSSGSKAKKEIKLDKAPKTAKLPQQKEVKFQKITNEKKEMIEEVVKEMVNEEAIPIVLYLIGKTRVSEFIIAQDLDLEIHRARNILYKLFENNILSFQRKKDKIKGWYICYWDFNEKSLSYLYEKIKSSKLQKLKERLDKESSSTFYMCKTACTRMDFEKAMEFNFKCPECGNLMDEQNNSRTVEFLNEKIKELDKEVKGFS